MNIFVLCTGRSGSVTFINACSHITNYSSGHETRSGLLGEERLNYPGNHIEADNRLSWVLGRLEEKYGNNAIYIHLTRNSTEIAESFEKRFDSGIIAAYSKVILLGSDSKNEPIQFCMDYVNTINANIKSFLKNKTNKMEFRLENAKDDFKIFWKMISAEGSLDAAIAEWDVKYNKTDKVETGFLKKFFTW